MSATMFDALIATAQEREANEQAAREQRRAKEKVAREQRENEERATLERRRDQYRKDQEQAVINLFVSGFNEALVKKRVLATWSAARLTEMAAYVEALVSRDGDALPALDAQAKRLVNGMFAYGLALAHKRGKSVPDGALRGQRQDWFAELFDAKLKEVPFQQRRDDSSSTLRYSTSSSRS